LREKKISAVLADIFKLFGVICLIHNTGGGQIHDNVHGGDRGGGEMECT